MILEGIVTTITSAGAIHIAPMGPRVDADMRRLLLRPFPTSQTYRNLKAHGEGVLHVTDDVLLLAQAALGPVEPPPPLVPAARVRGFVLAGACRYYEFRVLSLDEREERVRIEAEVVHAGYEILVKISELAANAAANAIVHRFRLRSTSEPPPSGPAPVPTPKAPDSPESLPECIRIRKTRTTHINTWRMSSSVTISWLMVAARAPRPAR